ncbi:MAG: DsbA family protein [Micrococcales bacterium]|nr:DsbA family protein [Micrococcales bacterium]
MGANAKKRREAAATSGSMSRQDKINAAAPKGGGGPNKILLATIAAIVAIAAVVGAVIMGSQGEKTDSAGGSALPAGATKMGGGLVSNTSATLVDKAPTLDIYEDFQCPACHQAEQLLGAKIDELAKAGKIKLTYHVMNFLDTNLKNDASTRAAKASFCAADAGKFQPVHDAIFTNQPANEGDGWTDEQLKKFVTDAGVDAAAYDSCVKSDKHAQYLDAVQTQTTKDGVTSTPTFKLNGEQMKLAGMTPDTFAKAIEDATK